MDVNLHHDCQKRDLQVSKNGNNLCKGNRVSKEGSNQGVMLFKVSTDAYVYLMNVVCD